MPAVQLARLKAEIQKLSWQFTNPVEFERGLRDLLERYADRVYRPGETLQFQKRTPAYRAPAIVLRQLELDLERLCRENPGAALLLAETLWKQPYLEPRLLAAFLLGRAPLSPPEAALERLRLWCQASEDMRLIDEVLKRGSARTRQEQPEQWLQFCRQWLEERKLHSQRLGLRALLPAIHDREFENLPPVYPLIAPFLQSEPTGVQGELKEVLQALAARSPKETAFFLRQLLSIGLPLTSQRLIRRLLPAFSPEYQTGLRSALFSASAAPPKKNHSK